MPSLPNLNFITEVLRQYHTIELKLKTGSDAIESLKTEMTTVRAEQADMKSRIAVLEESRNTLRVEMERVKAETIAELRAVKAETIAELKVQQTRYEADLYHKFVDAQAEVKQRSAGGPTPQIEK